jgi:hypothetical protein
VEFINNKQIFKKCIILRLEAGANMGPIARARVISVICQRLVTFLVRKRKVHSHFHSLLDTHFQYMEYYIAGI